MPVDKSSIVFITGADVIVYTTFTKNAPCDDAAEDEPMVEESPVVVVLKYGGHTAAFCAAEDRKERFTR